MSDFRALLKDGDPIVNEPPWIPDEVARTRRMVVAAAVNNQRAARWWPQPVFVGISVALTIAAAVVATRRVPVHTDVHFTPGVSGVPSASVPPAGSPTQLQFSTPGGTRVIWVFNPDLEL